MSSMYLHLESGECFEGTAIGAAASCSGEIVFNTSMTGYQEMMTDPSYKHQLLTFTYPLIGNYGWNTIDDEGTAPSVAGVLVHSGCAGPNHFESAGSLDDYLKKHGIPGADNIDTRAVVKAIRRHGTVKAVLSPSPETPSFTPLKHTAALVEDVTTNAAYTFGREEGRRVAVLDYGCKQSILHALKDAGCHVKVFPAETGADEVHAYHPDGVLFSNGPGDPAELQEYYPVVRELSSAYPSLGICLGHQLIAMAYGADSEKLPFGHRGGNHPVRHQESGFVAVTSQNHGYVIREESLRQTPFESTFVNVNDGTVEGLQHPELPIQTVQFHPEAHPGPSDTHFVFQQFIDVLQTGGKQACPTA
ncbi:carbamoyl phosphate synthase small subunit [Alkalicoccus chagannorensis]|uniref:carbamoyl phosphate synthase small subunit n=1 Tax=Alkalicoccus chagannorensis TaxID=427072 RepID=UPI00047E1EB4|nr:carbamoyl phosphate synthase small subunit [Alkalicoccus chagannorensis]